MHFTNKLLPAEEKHLLPKDEAHSLKEVGAARIHLAQIEANEVSQQDVSDLLRLLHLHTSLKYHLPVRT
jgi:hypothetical protein